MQIDLSTTILICNRKTKRLTQMCLESILSYYPDVDIVVVDDCSNDDSLLYLQYKQLTNPNILLIESKEDSLGLGHGNYLHIGIGAVKTRYVLLVDSDVVFFKGGFLEFMEKHFEQSDLLYALGVVQKCSYKNNGGMHESDDDILLYAHPQFSMYDLNKYKQLNSPFIGVLEGNDGNPCIKNMKAAKDIGFLVRDFNFNFYGKHLGAGSYADPQPIWQNDFDVKMRPFLTVIISKGQSIDISDIDTDYDIVVCEKPIEKNIQLHGEKKLINNHLYGIRFNLQGEYIVDITNISTTPNNFITELKTKVIECRAADMASVFGINCFKRKYFQENNCLQ